MKFKDKYDKVTKDKKDSKVIISDEAFAIGDMLQDILDKLEHLRLSNLK